MPTRLKTTTLCLTLALALLLGACGKDDDSGTSASESTADSSALSSSTSAASGSLEDSSTIPVSAAPALPVLDELPLGGFAYLDTEGLFPDDRAPHLELQADNHATFRVNTGNGMGTVQGNVVFQGSDLTFYIESLELDVDEPFWGDNLQSLTFRVLDANRLEYTGAPFGLTQRMMVFARQEAAPVGAALVQGSGTAPAPDPAAPPANQNVPQDITGPVGNVTEASSASPSHGDNSGSMAENQPQEEEDTKIPVVEPDKTPPETLKKGASIRLDGIDPDSLAYDAAHFDAMPSSNGESVTLTALLEGDTTLSYTTTQGKFAGQNRSFSISIVEKGVRLWLVIAIAAASAAVGGTIAVVTFVTLKKRRENKEERLAAAAEKKVQKAAQAVQKKEERQEKAEEQKEKSAVAKEKRKAKQDAQKAKAQEKKATKLAKKKNKQATAAAKKASKAAQEAEKAAEKAAAAAEKTSRLTGGKPPAEAQPEKPAEATATEEDGGPA